MKIISEAVENARKLDSLVVRDFVWFEVRNRSTNATVYDGYWNGIGKTAINVLNPLTGTTESREFRDSGGLIKADSITLVSNLTTQTIKIKVSGVLDRINNLVRLYDPQQGVVEFYQANYNKATREIIDAAECVFRGRINYVEIPTPAENDDDSIVIYCTDQSEELNRNNPDTRSHESQILRSATDDFLKDADTVGDWVMFWGKTNGTLTSSASNQKGAPVSSQPVTKNR